MTAEDVEPLFLSVEEVLALHEDQLRLFGGSGGLRDRGVLEAAVAMPAATFDGAYLHSDLFEMAAAYAFTLRKVNLFWMETSGLRSTPRWCSLI